MSRKIFAVNVTRSKKIIEKGEFTASKLEVIVAKKPDSHVLDAMTYIVLIFKT